MSSPPDIFLSYNREDQARAKLFADAFEREGLKVWWDVGLRTDEAYDKVTENALRTAKAVVVLWSKQSVQSRWVRGEATIADIAIETSELRMSRWHADSPTRDIIFANLRAAWRAAEESQ